MANYHLDSFFLHGNLLNKRLIEWKNPANLNDQSHKNQLELDHTFPHGSVSNKQFF